MEKLLDAITVLVCLIPPEKVDAIAVRIRQSSSSKSMSFLNDLVGTAPALTALNKLVDTWKVTKVSVDELASMLLAASHLQAKISSKESIELVWTGPATPSVSTRRTEQALLQVINGAVDKIFITSFVAYKVPSIVSAINGAIARDVRVSILLELSKDHGGGIDFDVIGEMKSLVPQAEIYSWGEKSGSFDGGRVHAKIAVADGKTCFITSANLTGYAMGKNMEAGILITGGNIPLLLDDHLRALVTTNIIAPA